MSAQDRAPAYAISLLAGILTFIGGLAKASTTGIIKYTASGAAFNTLVGNSVRATNFGLAISSARISAVILILSGILVLVSAVVMSFRSHQYPAWGTIIIVFSVMGLFAGGNFLTGVGSVLGIIGGLLAITYKTRQHRVLYGYRSPGSQGCSIYSSPGTSAMHRFLPEP